MITISRCAITVWVAVISLVAFSVGFEAAAENKGAEMNREAAQYRRLLLLPINNAVEKYGEGQIGKCEICGASYETGPAMNSAPAFLTETIKSVLLRKVAIKFLPQEQYQELRSRLLLLHPDGIAEKELILAIGAELNADAVLTGSVYRFQERIGSDYAVETPAFIGFELDLIDIKTGIVRWNRRYEKTQHALSENLFEIGSFIKRKGRWVTAEDLAIEGIEKVLETIPVAVGNIKIEQ